MFECSLAVDGPGSSPPTQREAAIIIGLEADRLSLDVLKQSEPKVAFAARAYPRQKKDKRKSWFQRPITMGEPRLTRRTRKCV
jgi:hypothetical protein